MAIIYETINLYNRDKGLSPWRYIGSDQHNNPSYLGSNKKLKEDIRRLGHECFKKTILEDFGDIDNKQLRQIEAEKYLKIHNVKKDNSYYNETDIYAPGGGKRGMKHSQIFSRTDEWKKSRRGYNHTEESKKLMASKKLGTKIKQSTKEKMSESQNGGLNNSNSLEWDIIFPNGQQIRVKSLRTYCRNNNLSFDDIYFKRNGWNHIKHGAGKGGGRKKKEKSSEY